MDEGGGLGLLATWAVAVGPVAGVIALLNRRDRRRAALADLAYRQLDAEALRTDVTVHAWCGLLGRGGHVTVDMRGRPREAVWDAVARLRAGLPPRVRLTVEGAVAPARPARITVEWSQRHASNSPAAPWPPPTHMVTTP